MVARTVAVAATVLALLVGLASPAPAVVAPVVTLAVPQAVVAPDGATTATVTYRRSGRAVASAVLTLQTRSGTAWRDVAVVRVTDGRARTTLRPRATTTYRVRNHGGSAVSAAVTVRVVPPVVTAQAPVTAAPGAASTVRATYTKLGRPVPSAALRVQARQGTTWTDVGTVRVAEGTGTTTVAPDATTTLRLRNHDASAVSAPFTIVVAPVTPPPGEVAPSAKRGVASARYLYSDARRLTALRTSWVYGWSTTPPADTRGLEFVPMLWGPGSVTDGQLAELREGARTGRYTTLLGFNEPDLHDQSNMSVEEALALWPRLEQTGLRLVSPAPTTPWNGWLDRFMTGAAERGLRVDAVALHYYQDFTDPWAVARLEGELREVHRRYGRPIWVTELGTFDVRAWGLPMQGEPTHERADAYLREVTAMLESLPFVERYAWFTDNCTDRPDCRFSTLYDGGGGLTSHGRTFATAAGANVG